MKIAGCKGRRGFTLIELMIVIVVIAVGLALAVPSYTRAVNKRGVINAAEQSAAALRSAQSLAVKIRAPITVTVAQSGAVWCLVATADTTTCDCTVANFAAACNGIRTVVDGGVTSFVIDDEDVENVSDLQEEVEIYLAGSDGTANNDFRRAALTALAPANPLGFTFEPVRGILSADNQAAGSFEFTSTDGNYGVRINVNPLGNVTACSSGTIPVAGFAGC